MFGDTEAYQDKFKTCARTREFGSQKLGSEFYEKEHTKPILKSMVSLRFKTFIIITALMKYTKY